MNIQISRRVQSLTGSATLAVAARAKALKEQGVDVVDLSAGEPDFDTPQSIKDAAIAALGRGDTKYPSPVSGRTPLREAIRGYLKKHCGIDYALNQVHVSVGAKDAIAQALTALLDPGDECIVPVPYWVSYPEQVKMAGGTPVLVKCDAAEGRKLSPAQLKAAITPRTRVLILNSPNNPTGAVYTRAEQAALADVLRNTNVVVLSDELYHRLILADVPHVSFAALDGMFERTVTINGMSKTFAMTGWRLGFAAGPEEIIAGMGKIQSQTTSGAVSFVQAASVAALTGDQSFVEEMCAAYRQRGARMANLLNKIPGVSCPPAEGGFVCLAHVAEVFGRVGVKSADELAATILEKSHVALVSGSAFGTQEHVRLSFAASMEQIEKGLERIGKLLAGR